MLTVFSYIATFIAGIVFSLVVSEWEKEQGKLK